MGIRLSAFLSIFVIIALWEILAPRKTLTSTKSVRWLNNLTLVVINSFILRVLFPASSIGLAILVQDQNWGLLNYFEVSFPIAVIFSLIVMDLMIYFQHVLFHAVPVLWRLHKVHHADPDYDITTGIRFHPIEMILSMLIKFSFIMVLGAPLIAVILFEVILNGAAMFNHGNIRLPIKLDKWLRWFIVTPDMHRVHHSRDENETNSNFGFNLPWWDRLFGTYIEQPQAGHQNMKIGIPDTHDKKEVTWINGIMWMPFKNKFIDDENNR
jgi:sterol desaturase/sphingolipid hydroxylase (fatty acid hydroxylase superfamily)